MSKFVVNHEYTPVPSYFIENCLKDASGAFLKVYLYALNIAVRGGETDNASIAKELNLLESDVLQAFEYWKKSGMIIEDSGITEFCATPIQEDAVINTHTQSKSHSPSPKSYDTVEVAKKISENQSLSELVTLAQDLLSKPLTTGELESLYWFYDELGFSTEAILLILDYCISIDKKNIRYIEKVAISWHEKGIISTDSIIKYMAQEEEKNGIMYRVKKGMGLDRLLSKPEEQYIRKWHDEYNYDDDMILYAYELCLLNTSKLSFPYIDKIIERWNKMNLRTRQEVDDDNKKHKNKTSANTSFSAYSDVFNHNDLEKLTRGKNND